MILVPAKVHILATVKTGSVYYFEEERLSSLEPHYFIVVNKNPKSDEVLLLVCASSQIEKRKDAIRKLGFAEETLVLVSPRECPCFNKDTAIDRNTVWEKTSQSVIEKLSNRELRVCPDEIPGEIVKKLIKGVLISNQVSEDIKVLIR